MPHMIPSIPVFIGFRYIHAKRRHQFISFVSGFSLLGMALGTLALILVLSVMNGFDREIKQRILSLVPHAFVDQIPLMQDWQDLRQDLADFDGIVDSAPYIGSFVMLGGTAGVLGVELQAVMPDIEKGVSNIGQFLLPPQQFDDLSPGKFGIFLGNLVARSLGVTVGDRVVMTLPQVSVTPAGVFPRVKRFKVVGVFEVGAQVDQSLALIHLQDAQRLFRYGNAVDGLRLQTEDIYKARTVVQGLAEKLGTDFESRDWSQTQGSLFQAIQLEKRMVTLLLLIIILVAALNIVTSLVLMVSDKRSDIAVLRTLGLSTRQTMSVFIIQGSAVGIVGIVIGATFGCILALNISELLAWFERTIGIYIFDPSVYFISEIPSELRLKDIILVCGIGIVLSILATLYPAYRATQIEPAEVLRYE